MIGIDIVDHRDLALKKRDSSHFRFMAHPNDRSFDGKAPHPDHWWYFWAAKEAVFKARRRKSPWNPKSIEIMLHRPQLGNQVFLANFNATDYQGWVLGNKTMTVAIARKHVVSRYKYGWFTIPSGTDQSRAVRKLATQALERQGYKHAGFNTLDGVLPVLATPHQTYLEASFSHHFELGAFAIKLE